MRSPRLRLADLLTAAPSRDTSSYGRCRAHGCLEATRENKDFCLDHLGMIPYVADLERKIAARQAQDANVRELGEKAVDVDSVTVIEMLRHLDQYGPRTEERCVRELTLDDVTLQGYIEALRAKGFVDTGRTKRGSTVVMIAEAGREHMRRAGEVVPAPSILTGEVVPAPSIPTPAARNVSADDAKLPTVADRGSSKTKGKPAMNGNGTGKPRRSKLREAHAACEKAYSELAKAHASGDREEVALVWNDVVAADAAVAAVKANVLAGILVAPGEKKASKPPTEKTATKAKPATSKKPAVTTSAFSNWLRVVRTGLGLSQVTLGEKIGASETQMWNWENGRRTPGDEYVAKIERLAGKTCPHRQKAAV